MMLVFCFLLPGKNLTVILPSLATQVLRFDWTDLRTVDPFRCPVK